MNPQPPAGPPPAAPPPRPTDVDTGFHQGRKTRSEKGTTAAMLRDIKVEDKR